MFQCAACGLLSLRGETCHGCGGRTMLDLEDEGTMVPEGMGDVPGLDEAVVVLGELAPFELSPKAEVIETSDSELPFGFGGHAREYVSTLPFGIGASHTGLSHLLDEEHEETAPAASIFSSAALSTTVGNDDVHRDEAFNETSEWDSEPEADIDEIMVPSSVASHVQEFGYEVSVSASDMDGPVHAGDPEQVASMDNEVSTMPTPDLWASSISNVRAAYGLTSGDGDGSAVESESYDDATLLGQGSSKGGHEWPPFSLMAPDQNLLQSQHQATTQLLFRSLANGAWEATIEHGQSLLEAGVQDEAVLTALGVAHVEHARQTAQSSGFVVGYEHLKEVAKMANGSPQSLANLAVALAMGGRLEPLAKVVQRLPVIDDVDGHLARAREAAQIAQNLSS